MARILPGWAGNRVEEQRPVWSLEKTHDPPLNPHAPRVPGSAPEGVPSWVGHWLHELRGQKRTFRGERPGGLGPAALPLASPRTPPTPPATAHPFLLQFCKHLVMWAQ